MHLSHSLRVIVFFIMCSLLCTSQAFASLCTTYHGECYNNSTSDFSCATNCGGNCYSSYNGSSLCGSFAQCCSPIFPTATPTPSPTPGACTRNGHYCTTSFLCTESGCNQCLNNQGCANPNPICCIVFTPTPAPPATPTPTSIYQCERSPYGGVCYANFPQNESCAINCGGNCYNGLCGTNMQCCSPLVTPTPIPPTPTPECFGSYTYYTGSGYVTKVCHGVANYPNSGDWSCVHETYP